MKSKSIVWVFVGLLTASNLAAAWVTHLERVINPGDSVTIYCELPPDESEDDCSGLSLGGFC